jgi:hypothetical protein
MKKIKHNNYTLPNVGACVKGVKDEDKQEFLRLIQKAYGNEIRINGIEFKDFPEVKYVGVPLHFLTTAFNWYYYSDDAKNVFTILPISEAIQWLKIGVGEITKESWVVDVTVEHERLDEFMEWFSKTTNYSMWRFDCKYYGFQVGRSYTHVLNRPNIPIISLDQFFAYFYEEEQGKKVADRQPVKSDLVEVSRNGKHWINSSLRWYSGAQNQVGEYITELNGDLYAWKYIRLPRPTPRELAEKKASTWLKLHGYDYSVPAILEPMTEYILKTEFNNLKN